MLLITSNGMRSSMHVLLHRQGETLQKKETICVHATPSELFENARDVTLTLHAALFASILMLGMLAKSDSM